MSNYNKEIVLGLLAGGLLIGGAALLFSSSSTRRRLKRHAMNKYRDIRNSLEDMLSGVSGITSNGASLAKDTYDGVSEKIKDFAEYVKEESEDLDPEYKQAIFLAVGGIIGAALGVGAFKIFSLAFEEEPVGLKTNLKNVLGKVGLRKSRSKRPLNELVNFATAGLNLWQNIKNK